MNSSRLVLLASCAVIIPSLASNSASSVEPCPLYPLGVTSHQTNEGETYYATNFARPFTDGEEALIEAHQESRLSARLLLRHDKRVPHPTNGRLVGAIDQGSCVADGRVYFSVSINLKSAAKAIELDERIKKSLTAKPTTGVPSYSWVTDENERTDTKDIRDRLK